MLFVWKRIELFTLMFLEVVSLDMKRANQEIFGWRQITIKSLTFSIVCALKGKIIWIHSIFISSVDLINRQLMLTSKTYYNTHPEQEREKNTFPKDQPVWLFSHSHFLLVHLYLTYRASNKNDDWTIFIIYDVLYKC